MASSLVHLCRREAVKCLLDDHNTIMVTWANFHYQDFVMNWVEHVKEVGVKSYLVSLPSRARRVIALDSLWNVTVFGMSVESLGGGPELPL